MKQKKIGPIVKEDVVDTTEENWEGEGGAIASEEIFERPVDVLVSITSPYQFRHPLSARFHQFLKDIGDLHDKKQRDYGTKEDPFANIRGATEFGVAPYIGAFLEMNGCMQKIKSLSVNGRLENDAVENVLKDMAVFSLIALVLWEENESNEVV